MNATRRRLAKRRRALRGVPSAFVRMANGRVERAREWYGVAKRIAEDAKTGIAFDHIGDAWFGTIGGSCPVQGIGYVDDLMGRRRGWYFRARGDRWLLEVYDVWPFLTYGDGMEILPDVSIWEVSGDDEDASYMPIEVARDLIEHGLKAWRFR